MDYLAAALPGTGLRHGLLIDVVLAAYGQAAQELLDPRSNFATQNLNFVLLAFDFRALGFSRVFLKKEEADDAVSAAINYVSSLAAGVRDTVRATCILQTLVPPCRSGLRWTRCRIPGSPRAMMESFNVRLLQEESGKTISSSMPPFSPAKSGLDCWNDARGWHKAKLPAVSRCDAAVCRAHLQATGSGTAARPANAWYWISTTRYGEASLAMTVWMA